VVETDVLGHHACVVDFVALLHLGHVFYEVLVDVQAYRVEDAVQL
jgi:hypothetical protein